MAVRDDELPADESAPATPRRGRPRTENPKRVSLRVLAQQRAQYPDDGGGRPKTRGDCVVCETCQEWRDHGPKPIEQEAVLACGHTGAQAVMHSRPCVFVGCVAMNLGIDVNPRTGSLTTLVPTSVNGETPESCALDVVDKGIPTLEEIGAATGRVRERIRQIETEALETIRAQEGADVLRDMLDEWDTFVACRPAPAWERPGQHRTEPIEPDSVPEDMVPGGFRRRVYALLKQHPAGLTIREIAHALELKFTSQNQCPSVIRALRELRELGLSTRGDRKRNQAQQHFALEPFEPMPLDELCALAAVQDDGGDQ